jgi:hypothetical protein
MKLKSTTIVLILFALGLGGFIYFVEIKNKLKSENIENAENEIMPKLFNFSEKDIKILTIQTEKTVLKFEQTEDKTKPWQMIEPEKVTASEPSISFLTNLLIEAKKNQTFVINKNQLMEYGLDKPIAKILIGLKNQQEKQIILGKPNFDDTLIYAQINPQQQNENSQEIILVSKSFQYAVNREFNDWKQPLENDNQDLPKNDDKNKENTSETQK